MDLWTGLIFVVFLGIVGYLLRDFFLQKEGFQTRSPAPFSQSPTSHVQGPSAQILELQLEERRFLETAAAPAIAERLEKKRDLFHYGYGPQGLPVDAAFLEANPDYPSQLDKALYTPGDSIRVSQTLVPIERGPSLEGDLATCRAIQNPADIPNINPASCGWYLVPDISGVGGNTYRSSYCVPGSEKGPHPNLQRLPTGGTWYWNKEAATAAEAKKVCAREVNCLQQSSSCAFCADDTVNHALPYNRETGQLMYGGTCKNLQPTCPAGSAADSCKGELSVETKKTCLLKLLDNLGVSADGLLKKYVSGTLSASEKDRMTLLLQVMNTRARWRSDLLELQDLNLHAGVLPVDVLTRKLRKIVAAKTSYDTLVAGIAAHFVDGTPFNSAAFYYQTAQSGVEPVIQNAQQALALKDLQQEFRKSGCQAAGADYPTTLPPTGSLADHRTRFQQLRFQMQNEGDPQKQEDAIRRCLNATLTFPPAAAKGPFCNEPGIEYLLYSPVEGPRATLISRFISKVGLLRAGSSYSEAAKLKTLLETGPLSDIQQIAYVARTVFSIPGTVLQSDKWNLPPIGIYTFRVNNQVIPSGKSGDDAPAIPYRANEETMLEIQYIVNSSVASQRSEWGLPNYPWITQNLRQFRLLQESHKPFVQFDFSQNLLDTNRIATIVGNPAFSPRFTAAPTSSLRTYGLQEPARVTPRFRSSLVQILDMTVFVPVNPLVSLVKLVESESYYEELTLERTQLVYTIFNGAESLQFVGPFANGFDPFRKPLRIVLVFTKKGNILTVQFLYENGGLQSVEGGTKEVKGSLGFRRSLELQLQPGIQTIGLYDRKSVSSDEGFQNPSTIPDILQSDINERRYEAESTFNKVDASTYIPNTILKDSPIFTGAVNAPVAYADMTTGKCTYKPVSVGSAGDFKYEEKFLYDKEFVNAKPLSTSNQESLKACYDSCGNTGGCVGMAYASDTGLCTFYETILNDITKPNDKFVSLIMPGKNKTVTDLQNRAKTAIQLYQSMRAKLSDGSTKYKDQTKFGTTTRQLTEEDIKADLAAIDKTEDPDCLNAFLQKYTLRSN
jgi:hypothetical protein